MLSITLDVLSYRIGVCIQSSSVPPSEVGIHNSLFRRTRNEGGHRRYPARQIRPTRRLGAVEDSIDDFLNPPERNIQTESVSDFYITILDTSFKKF